MTRARSGHRKYLSAALLAKASAVALLAAMPDAAAQDCAGQAAPPGDLATPSMVYEALSARTNAQLLAMGFLRKPVDAACAWIYEVRLMTASGSVVELDFNADGLALIGARGPQNDRDAADLVKTLGGNAGILTTREEAGGKGSGASSEQGSSGPGSDGHGGDDGDEGGNSGSGSDHGGSGSGEGGEGGDSGSGGGEGGEGGNSGSGSDGGGGEGGDGEGGDD